MYRTFFYILLLAAAVAVHCVYLWNRERAKEDRQPWERGAVIFLVVLAALCAGAVIAGLAVVLSRGDPTVSHAMGGIALLMAIWFDFRLGRACGK